MTDEIMVFETLPSSRRRQNAATSHRAPPNLKQKTAEESNPLPISGFRV